MSGSAGGIEGGRKPNLGPSVGPANRRALIAAAREIFGAEGIDAPLNSIAKRAGVGQGSLYRHFPDRIGLAAAVFDENLDVLETSVARPETTLADLLRTIVDQAVVSAGLIELTWRYRRDSRIEHLGARMRALIATLLEREHAAGRIGAHVTVDDVELAISMLADVLARVDVVERPFAARRALAIFRAAFAPR